MRAAYTIALVASLALPGLGAPAEVDVVVEGIVRGGGLVVTPTRAVVFERNGRNLRLLDRATGKPVGEAQLKASSRNDAIVVGDHVVYGNGVFALADGKRTATLATDYLRLVARGDRLYGRTGGGWKGKGKRRKRAPGRIERIDLATGKAQWSKPDLSDRATLRAVAQGVVIQEQQRALLLYSESGTKLASYTRKQPKPKKRKGGKRPGRTDTELWVFALPGQDDYVVRADHAMTYGKRGKESHKLTLNLLTRKKKIVIKDGTKAGALFHRGGVLSFAWAWQAGGTDLLLTMAKGAKGEEYAIVDLRKRKVVRRMPVPNRGSVAVITGRGIVTDGNTAIDLFSGATTTFKQAPVPGKSHLRSHHWIHQDPGALRLDPLDGGAPKSLPLQGKLDWVHTQPRVEDSSVLLFRSMTASGWILYCLDTRAPTLKALRKGKVKNSPVTVNGAHVADGQLVVLTLERVGMTPAFQTRLVTVNLAKGG